MIPASKRQDPAAWLPTAQPTFNLESHSSSVNCIAFHPVFSSLASGSDDCTIKIWDWELGGLERTIKAHTLPVRDLDFGGHRNTILLASCSTDRAIKLWDPTDNYKNIRTLMGHEHAVTSVRFLPGNERNTILLVSASADRTIRLWDATTGYCVQTLQGHGHWVRSVSPSDDGRLILSASSDKTACLWDIKQNTGPIQTLIGHDDVINCCAFAPLSAHQHISSLAGVSTAVHSSSFSEFFATGSRDKTIKLWNASGTCLKTLLGHDSWVTALVFHPGGKYIFSVAEDKTLRIWDLSQNGQCISVLPGVHGGFITCLRWAPSAKNMRVQNEDGQQTVASQGKSAHAQFRCAIATGSMDKTLKVFSLLP